MNVNHWSNECHAFQCWHCKSQTNDSMSPRMAHPRYKVDDKSIYMPLPLSGQALLRGRARKRDASARKSTISRVWREQEQAALNKAASPKIEVTTSFALNWCHAPRSTPANNCMTKQNNNKVVGLLVKYLTNPKFTIIPSSSSASTSYAMGVRLSSTNRVQLEYGLRTRRYTLTFYPAAIHLVRLYETEPAYLPHSCSSCRGTTK